MERRTIVRFRTRTRWLHWIHTACFVALLITGALMFFHLTGLRGGQQVRLAHRVAAALFVAAPAVYSLLDPRAAAGFLKSAFQWSPGDIAWVKLWQCVVIISGIVSTVTGVVLWFFTLKVPLLFSASVLLAHAASFVVVALLFPVHFSLRTLHPDFEESLSSMLDGKISPGYAKRRYPQWLERVVKAQPTPAAPPVTKVP